MGRCESAESATCLLDVLIFQNEHVLRQQLAREANVHRSLCKPIQVHALWLSAGSRSPAPQAPPTTEVLVPCGLTAPFPTSWLAAVIGSKRLHVITELANQK